MDSRPFGLLAVVGILFSHYVIDRTISLQLYFKKNLNASKPPEHSPSGGISHMMELHFYTYTKQLAHMICKTVYNKQPANTVELRRRFSRRQIMTAYIFIYIYEVYIYIYNTEAYILNRRGNNSGPES